MRVFFGSAAVLAATLGALCAPVLGQNIKGLTVVGSYIRPGTVQASAGIWGWTSPSGKEFALLTSRRPGGLSFVDISNPAQPKEINFIQSTGNSIWHEVHSYRNYAYKVSQENSDGLQIINMAPLDQGRPATLVKAPTTWFKVAHTLYVDTTVSPARLFVAYENTAGVMIFTLEDPENPKPVKTIPGETHDMFARGNRLFACNQFKSTLTVWNISDVQNPVKLSVIDFNQVSPSQGEPGRGISHNAWLSEDNRYLFTTEETAGTTVKAFDLNGISLSKPPALVGKYVGVSGIIPHNVYVKGSLMYVGHYTAGMRIVDIANPASMKEIAYHRPSSSRELFGGTWGVYPWFKSGNIIHGDDVLGLQIVKSTAAVSVSPADPRAQGMLLAREGGRFDLRLDRAGPYVLSVLGADGRVLLRREGPALAGSESFNLRDGGLSAGSYLVRLTQGGRAASLPVTLGR